MATFDKGNVVIGACKLGVADQKSAAVALFSSAAAIGASSIVLTGTTLGVAVGDPLYLDDGTKSTLIAALKENAVVGAKTVEITGKTLGIEVGDTIYLDDTANAHHEFGVVTAVEEGATDTTVTLRDALCYAYAAATASAYEVTSPHHEVAIATLVTEATNTTVTLLHKLQYAYASATAIAHDAARTLWGVTRDSGLRFSTDMDITEIFSDQVRGPVKRHVKSVARNISADFQEIIPSQLKNLRGFSTSVIGTWPEQTLIAAYDDNDLPELMLHITGPAPGGNYFRYTCHARVNDSGELTRGSGEEVCIPESFGEIVNLDTNEYGVFAFSATTFE